MCDIYNSNILQDYCRKKLNIDTGDLKLHQRMAVSNTLNYRIFILRRSVTTLIESIKKVFK